MNDPYLMAPLNLDTSVPQFRLLELHPRTSNSTIMCTLSSYSLDGCHPAYKALSYTWGQKANPHPILLNGNEFRVGRSLWTFLEQMCLQGQYGVYWIDAVCINQDSVLEKNHQVQRMRRIYSTAEEVVVWLGEVNHDEMSDRAMDLLASSSWWIEVEGFSPFNADVYSGWAIKKILNKDYWRRIWIVQEIMVAERISVYCGSKSLEWQALTDFMTDLAARPAHTRHSIAHELSRTKAMYLVYEKEQARTTQEKKTLAELFWEYRDCAASNVLDKVYALCGLASDADNVIIDYDISPTDLVAHLICGAPRSCSELDVDKLGANAYLGLHWTEANVGDLLNSGKAQRLRST